MIFPQSSLLMQFLPVYFAVINLITYALFVLDKRAAKNNYWRISEGTLLTFILLGGTPAALYASKKIRHKTKKTSFIHKRNIIIVIQVIVGAALILVKYNALF